MAPKYDLYGDLGFPIEGELGSYPLAVSAQGVFDSFYKGKSSPLQASDSEADDGSVADNAATLALGVIESSPESARLVVVASNEFVNDAILRLSSTLNQNRYLNNLQFLQNGVDWAVEDLDLLGIRSRGTHARVLKPMDAGEQTTWEIANYAVALLALVGIGIVLYIRRRAEKPMELDPVAVDADAA